METLKDIFVPYEIAVKLKEIGFDEGCIGAYDCYCMLHIINSNDKFSLKESEIFAHAPTWEQVKKWFRAKGLKLQITYNSDFDGYTYTIFFMTDEYIWESFSSSEHFTFYQQTQEQLILKLIEIYKNGKTDI